MSISYHELAPEHFSEILALGNLVHGDNYLDINSINNLYERSWQDNINASWVALNKDGKLVGFRLTNAASQWHPDKWCSPDKWPVDASRVCYFKCNTVDESVRGQGVGSTLLRKSIASAQMQGALAGLAHIWMASPNNSAYGYFSACGGVVIKMHPNKWQHLCFEDNYACPVCDDLCTCTGAEMLLAF
ncbi:N-acetyltransferase [Alteromonas sediminis]|uniref:N-acetyltransferase n=1 Tax=Alteromonas sediminis TaxID=2259342 RepID=A0A3N5XXW3_9ALTE|nr:GNAT family N-acetyltransferase [Alteromonas sediminis]RPJ65927.1 N-acetyltransferase [Alteromonas sediminis]